MNESNSIECSSLEAIDKTILSEQTKFGLSEIIGIESYFYQEINQRESCSKQVAELQLFCLQVLSLHQLELEVQALL